MSDAVIVALISGAVTLLPMLITYISTNKKVVKEINNKIDKVESKLDKHIKDDEWSSIKECRVRIFRFSDSLNRGNKFSKEQWDDVLDDIDTYEKFCNSHTDYVNNKCSLTTKSIMSLYQKAEEEHDFMTPME